jgi:imidazolonepropionase-like amidohydrolase
MPITEMELMGEAGMTPMQIILAGTQNAAHVCNLDGELGTLEAGKIADVLIVDGNPLEDIHALTDARLVIHNGVVIRGGNEE